MKETVRKVENIDQKNSEMFIYFLCVCCMWMCS